MRNLVYCVVLLAGCGSQPEPRVEYIPVPDAYTRPCELPSAPANNAELSDGFAKAYKCAEQGNRDKQRIRELTNEH